MHFSSAIYLCLLVAACSVACKEKTIDVVPAPDPALSWQADNDFLFDEKIQLNSYADSSLIILSGSQTTSIAPGDQRPQSDTSFVHYGGQAQPNGRTDYRPFLNASFVVFCTTAWLISSRRLRLFSHTSTCMYGCRNSMPILLISVHYPFMSVKQWRSIGKIS